MPSSGYISDRVSHPPSTNWCWTFCGVHRLVSSAASDPGRPAEGWLRTWLSLSGLFEIWVVHLDSDLSMNTHISQTVSCGYAGRRQIRSISRSVSQPVVQSLIICRLSFHDWTCVVRHCMVGLPAYQPARLKSLSNSRTLWRSDRQIQEILPRTVN